MKAPLDKELLRVQIDVLCTTFFSAIGDNVSKMSVFHIYIVLAGQSFPSFNDGL